MKLISFVETPTAYFIKIWLDETQIDRNGNPSPEWTFERQWGKVHASPNDSDKPVPITPEEVLSECRALAELELNSRLQTVENRDKFSHLI